MARIFHARVEPLGCSFSISDNEPILSGAHRAGIALPFECGWGSCGSCKAILVSGETRLLFAEAPAIRPHDRKRGRIILCQSAACSDVVLTVPPQVREDGPNREEIPKPYVGTLLASEDLSPEIRRIVFRLNKASSYKEGQYAILTLKPGLRRAYSMANLSGDNVVEFIVRSGPGVGTQMLWDLEAGDTVPMELPYGSMFLRPRVHQPVLIAGGTGIAPILALMRSLSARRHSGQLIPGGYLFYGARNPGELVLHQEMRQRADNLSFSAFFSVDHPLTPWTGEVGTVVDMLEGKLPKPWDLSSYLFYLAGPPLMVQRTYQALMNRGVAISAVSYDSFG